MPRLIDADKVQDRAFQLRFDMRISERELYIVNNLCNTAPTVDAEPVVRCKDCIHLGNGKFNCWGRDGDEFCSRGERKKDAGEVQDP